jgi:AhpD family alkylhydroperoxidase
MSTNFRALSGEISATLSQLRADIPDTMRGFSAMSQAALRDGALSRKTKELIAMALGIAAHCDACLAFHAEALVKLGCQRAEFEEMLAISVYMGGGPSLMYAARALDAFEQCGGGHAARPDAAAAA